MFLQLKRTVMFSIGLSEVLLVIIVGCLVTDPKKLPSVISTARTYYKKFDEVRAEIFASFRDICEGGSEESEDLCTTSRGKKRVVGDDGRVYEAYDVGDLSKLSNKNGVSCENRAAEAVTCNQEVLNVKEPISDRHKDNISQ